MPTGSRIAWCRRKRTKAKSIRRYPRIADIVVADFDCAKRQAEVVARFKRRAVLTETSCCNCGVNFFENFVYPVAKFPVWIMRLKLSHVADPPDVVADAIGFLVAPV